MGGLVWGLVAARQRVIARLSTAEARQAWDEWRQKTREQPQDAPVQRRPALSDEPPALVLMRDRFGVILAAVCVITTFLFGVMFALFVGAFRGGADDGR